LHERIDKAADAADHEALEPLDLTVVVAEETVTARGGVLDDVGISSDNEDTTDLPEGGEMQLHFVYGDTLFLI